MIVGADAASDGDIVVKASQLYDRFGLRRVYYSAFSPIPDASAVLPLKRPPLMREHRLYQSDWLMRFYGFKPAEVVDAAGRRRHAAARHRSQARLGAQVSRMLPGRRQSRAEGAIAARARAGHQGGRRGSSSRGAGGAITLDDVARLTVSIAKVRPFIVTGDWRPTLLTDRADLRALVAPKVQQLELFAA